MKTTVSTQPLTTRSNISDISLLRVNVSQENVFSTYRKWFIDCKRAAPSSYRIVSLKKCLPFELSDLQSVSQLPQMCRIVLCPKQSKGLVTIETLITILTIENLNSWQSLLPDNQEWQWTVFAILAMFYICWHVLKVYLVLGLVYFVSSGNYLAFDDLGVCIWHLVAGKSE